MGSIIGTGVKPSVSFKVVADGREHAIRVPGATRDFSLSALRGHVAAAPQGTVSAVVKVETDGFERRHSDLVAGRVVVPFMPAPHPAPLAGARALSDAADLSDAAVPPVQR